MANQTFVAAKQAELNEQAATGPVQKASKFISICCAGFAALGLMMNQSGVNQSLSDHNSSPATSAPTPLNPPPVARQEAPSRSEYNTRPPVQSVPLNIQPPVTRQESPSPPAPQSPQTPIEPSMAPLNLTYRNDAVMVQRRLVELGYLSGFSADGNWGTMSQQALVEFKKQAKLGESGTWDARTQTALFSENAPHAIRRLAFIGGWTPELGQCGDPGGPPPLRITTDHAETAGGTCNFSSVRPDSDNTWRIDANCTVGGITHLAHIRLSVRGSILEWSSEQPTSFYYRCGVGG